MDSKDDKIFVQHTPSVGTMLYRPIILLCTRGWKHACCTDFDGSTDASFSPPQLSDAKDYPITKHALGRSLVTIRRARPVKKFLAL